MYVGIVYTYLPFMVLPLYARLSQLDPVLLEAAADLGAPPRCVFLRVTLPLSLPGVWAGVLLVFIPAVGEYVIPELLGGPQAQLIGRMLLRRSARGAAALAPLARSRGSTMTDPESSWPSGSPAARRTMPIWARICRAGSAGTRRWTAASPPGSAPPSNGRAGGNWMGGRRPHAGGSR